MGYLYITYDRTGQTLRCNWIIKLHFDGPKERLEVWFPTYDTTQSGIIFRGVSSFAVRPE